MPVKILDEKGRLFGKLNLIDLVVILLAITALVVFLLGREWTTEPVEPSEPEQEYELTYRVLVTHVSAEIYESIKQYVDAEQGLEDQMFSSDSGNKYLDAYVVDCEASPLVEYVSTSDGQIKRVESSGADKRLDLTFTIRAKTTSLMTNRVGNQQVRIGAGHFVKTTHFEVTGTVMGLEQREL